MVAMARRRSKAASLYAGLTGKAVFIPLEAVPPRALAALKAHDQALEGTVQGPDSVHAGCVVVKLRVKGPGPGAPPLKLFFRADLVRSWVEPCHKQSYVDIENASKRQQDAEPEQGAAKKARHTTPCAHMQHDESCSTPPSSAAEMPAVVSQTEEADSDSTVHEAHQHIQSSAPSPIATNLNPTAPANQLLHHQGSTTPSCQEFNATSQPAEIDAQQMDGLEGPGSCANLATASDPSHVDAYTLVLPQAVAPSSENSLIDVPSTKVMQFSSNLVKRFVLGADAYFTLPAQTTTVSTTETAHRAASLPAAPPPDSLQCPLAHNPSLAPTASQSSRLNILREAMRQPATSKEAVNKEPVPRHGALTYTWKGVTLQPIAITRQACQSESSPDSHVITPIAVTASTLKVAQQSTQQQPIATTASRVEQSDVPAEPHQKSYLHTLQRHQQHKQQQSERKVKQQGVDADQLQAAHSDLAQQGAGMSLATLQPAGRRAHKGKPEENERPLQHISAKQESTTEVEASIERWGKPSKGYTRKAQVADIIGKVVYVPGPIFGVDVPDLYYRGKVVGPDPKHKDAAVVQLIEDDPEKYFFPIGQVREWVAYSETRAGNATTGVRSDEFAAEVLAAMHAGVVFATSDSDDE